MKPTAKHGLARVLSKLGICSRTQATALVLAGRVTVQGRVQRDPERSTAIDELLAVDGVAVSAAKRHYLAVNKPRGMVVTTSDERGRDTVYSLLPTDLPWLAPVGRLDKASEGLLLLTNDTVWAARITEPVTQVLKTYHVQISGLPDASLLQALTHGVVDQGETLSAVSATLLRAGEKNAWLEIVLDEGRNRHLRRLLAALHHDVLRLVRVAIGPIALNTLAKAQWRHLTTDEINVFKR